MYTQRYFKLCDNNLLKLLQFLWITCTFWACLKVLPQQLSGKKIIQRIIIQGLFQNYKIFYCPNLWTKNAQNFLKTYHAEKCFWEYLIRKKCGVFTIYLIVYRSRTSLRATNFRIIDLIAPATFFLAMEALQKKWRFSAWEVETILDVIYRRRQLSGFRHGHYPWITRSRDCLRYVLINDGSFRCIYCELLFVLLCHPSPQRIHNVNLRLFTPLDVL